MANGAYHGAVPWCNPYPAGSTLEDRAHLVRYDYNNAASLVAAADSCRGDLAAILVSGFKHDVGKLPNGHLMRIPKIHRPGEL